MLGLQLKRPPPLDLEKNALFLDIDGTIAEIAGLPIEVGPDAARNRLLTRLDAALGGRLAVLTGRTLERADFILDGTIKTIAAIHGLVRRDRTGAVTSLPGAPALMQAREELLALIEHHPGLVLEQKGLSLALHYRQAPDCEKIVLYTTAKLAAAHKLIVQQGAMVSELLTPGAHKGDALSTLMQEPPFVGSVPVMVGDDLTDEHAFAAANAAGGHGILVGPARQSHARYGLRSVKDVLAWLNEPFA